jgi:hypothetical protein
VRCVRSWRALPALTWRARLVLDAAAGSVAAPAAAAPSLVAAKLTHVDGQGRLGMVDVGGKAHTLVRRRLRCGRDSRRRRCA